MIITSLSMLLSIPSNSFCILIILYLFRYRDSKVTSCPLFLVGTISEKVTPPLESIISKYLTDLYSNFPEITKEYFYILDNINSNNSQSPGSTTTHNILRKLMNDLSSQARQVIHSHFSKVPKMARIIERMSDEYRLSLSSSSS